jgi:ankyrin repeat protein
MISTHSLLITAASQGKIEVIIDLIPKLTEHEINATNHTGYTALITAAERGHLNIVQLLIANNADVNIQAYPSGYTALMVAIEQNHLEVVEALLKAKANIDTRDDAGQTAMNLAIQNKNLRMIAALSRVIPPKQHDDGVIKASAKYLYSWVPPMPSILRFSTAVPTPPNNNTTPAQIIDPLKETNLPKSNKI